ncbi:PTS system, glucose subfamily, IIA component [Lachnospiraceae bacterium 28-4]|nr:PTS system, glucose subfamily, IIA component [Lachnospiraceae bacterium 28-4]
MFQVWKKITQDKELPPVSCGDNDIVAMADGTMIDVASVSDPVFAGKMMGESTAFCYEGSKVVICAPANGELAVLFPTGHAFGIRMKNGAELLVHIGIGTVNAKGDGFCLLDKKQGDKVRAGEPIVEVSLKKLSVQYDMSVMLIVTDDNGKKIQFQTMNKVQRGQKIIR